jgi:hypothetical protein
MRRLLLTNTPHTFTIAHLKFSIQILPGSSVVEQVTVNHLVGGSSPSRGAKSLKHMDIQFLDATQTVTV